jgi:hypothetical protein
VELQLCSAYVAQATTTLAPTATVRAGRTGTYRFDFVRSAGGESYPDFPIFYGVEINIATTTFAGTGKIAEIRGISANRGGMEFESSWSFETDLALLVPTTTSETATFHYATVGGLIFNFLDIRRPYVQGDKD